MASTLARRLAARKGAQRRYGETNPNWPSEALDLYLLNERVCDIAEAYGKSGNSVMNAIRTEALLRLMAQSNKSAQDEARVTLGDIPGIGEKLDE